MKQEVLAAINKAFDDLDYGAKKVSFEIKCEGRKYRVTAYTVNSSAKYSKPSYRLDIQDLEFTDYT